jgi:hypothetical protein
MAEELEQSSQDNSQNENFNRTEERIKDLSSKVRTASQERDDAAAKAQAEADARAVAEKERDFFKEFSTLTSKHPAAAEHQDAILEKVKAGYTPEDATVSVLNAEGKLSPITGPAQAPANAAGGSASTVIPTGDRGADQMTQAERRERLLEANASGELADVIKNFGR